MPEITSTVKRFPGTVVLPDAMTYPQYSAWAHAMQETRELEGDEIAIERALWSGAVAVVQEWHLENFDPKNIPATPRLSVVNLLTWLVGEISKLVNEADESPNG